MTDEEKNEINEERTKKESELKELQDELERLEDNEELKDNLKNCLERLPEDELVNVYNEYCDAISDYDSKLQEPNELIDELFENSEASSYDNYFGEYDADECRQASYVYFDGYGHLTPVNNIYDRIDMDELVDYIIKNDDYLHCGLIEDVFNEKIKKKKYKTK